MQNKLLKAIVTAGALISPLLVRAETNIAIEKQQSFNVLLTIIVSLAFALLLAIGMLGYVLTSLVNVYREHLKNDENTPTFTRNLLSVILLLLPLGYIHAQSTETLTKAPELIAGIASSDFYLLIGLVTLELLVIVSMLVTMAILVRLLSKKPETAEKVKAIVIKPFWDRFNKAVAVEKENDIMLDHDYDGIKELDNSLPPWWKYGFYLTIIVSIVYMYYYHFGGNGLSSLEEYEVEVQKSEEEKAVYLAQSANNVDENTIKMLDATGIAAGQQIFQSTCAACHAKDGGGGVGPNLTDDYWLHGGGIKEVFKSIKYGWADKGMKSWKDDFSPKQIAELASYVKSLKGSHPSAPKDKQGDLYKEDNITQQDSTVAINR